jgi:hypothetical protein
MGHFQKLYTAQGAGAIMEQSKVMVPVTCPLCAKEQLLALPIATIAEALLSGSVLLLSSECHGQWIATKTQREQIRAHLAGLSENLVR